VAEPEPEAGATLTEPPLTWRDVAYGLTALAKEKGEWAGIPIPLGDLALRVERRYPWKGIEELATRDESLVIRHCSTTDVDELSHIRNHWYSRQRDAEVWLYCKEGNPRTQLLLEPRTPAAQRMTFWIRTLMATDAWDFQAEARAVEKLAGLVKPHTLTHYLFTGSFLETSPRSGVTYLFRRLRPTLALRPGPKDLLHCLAALCLHPIAYYANSWAGCMVPTDDVLAHLMLMRADEHAFWKHSEQHNIDEPEAGI
jgi:hypothetical protein